jgi:hypothetical protein
MVMGVLLATHRMRVPTGGGPSSEAAIVFYVTIDEEDSIWSVAGCRDEALAACFARMDLELDALDPIDDAYASRLRRTVELYEVTVPLRFLRAVAGSRVVGGSEPLDRFVDSLEGSSADLRSS